MPAFAQVIVPRPLPGPFTYQIPESLRDRVQLGSFVRVPFRSTQIEGFVVELTDIAPVGGFETKAIEECPFEEPVFSAKDLAFFRWISDYYQLPMGEVFYSAFPRILFDQPKTRKAAKKAEENEEILPKVQPERESNLVLTQDQIEALDKIGKCLSAQEFRSFLLYGVTGSGKTEVYIRAARQVLDQGRGALILVPEIALTPQLRRRFVERFGDEVAVLHSGLSNTERRRFWWEILRGQKRVVVGARSALFAPLSSIGLIVVDEEHEPSYKQEDRLRYSARDLALVRARQHGAAAILGSATPSIETFYAAQTGKHELLALKGRPSGLGLPSVEVVDLRDEPREYDRKLVFGEKLRDGLIAALARGEQAMVFVNRKGYSSFLLCRDCGEVPKCLNCSVSLTYYQRARELRCHYCDLRMQAPDECGKCHSREIRFMGLGTELVEDELRTLLPEATIARLDADTATTGKKLEAILEDFRSGKIQILVGTQMLAKGHDYPNVTFIGVVLADTSLHLPDFRASERTFQLLEQVSGRAGRGEKPGKVVLQTFLPEHYVIQCAAAHDYESFYAQEIAFRKDFSYPPFSRLAQLEFRHLKSDQARKQAEKARDTLEHIDSEKYGVFFLGPAEASIAKIANQYRWHLLLRSEKTSSLNAVIKTLRKEGVRFIDVDPVSTL